MGAILIPTTTLNSLATIRRDHIMRQKRIQCHFQKLPTAHKNFSNVQKSKVSSETGKTLNPVKSKSKSRSKKFQHTVAQNIH